MKLNEYSDFMQKIKCNDEFRERMKKMLSSESDITCENEEKISVVKPSQKNVWIRIAAAAASFLIVCTAAVSLKNHLPSVGTDPDNFSTGTTVETTAETVFITEQITESDDSETETDPDIREVFSGAFDGAYVLSSEGKGGAPMVGTFYYDSIHRSYTVSDAEGLVNDLSSLKWEKCSSDEYDAAVCTNKDKGEFVRHYEIDINSSESVWNSVSISENGYIYDYPYYYRLADENEIQNDLHMIFEKYFVQTEESKLAEKISEGKMSFSNLDAHYTYELKSSYADCSLSGKLSIDHDGRDLMYMTGEGIFDEKDVSVEMVVNGENDTVYRMIDNETGEPYLKFAYGYNSANLNLTRLETQYYYICRDIENSLMMNVHSKVNNFLHIQLPADELCEYYWSCTTENGKVTENYHVALKDGVLVSYEKTDSSGCHVRFNLEKYTIDLDEFEFEKDVPALYDEILDQLTEYEGGRSDDEP